MPWAGRSAALALAAVVALGPRVAAALDPAVPVSQLVHEGFGSSEGLPPGAHLPFAQTADGILWFGSDQGVVRFDGVRFEALDRRRLPGLPSGLVTGVVADGQALWIVTAEGAARLEHGALVPLPPGGPGRGVRTPCLDGHGAAWFPAPDGLWRLAGGGWRRFSVREGLPEAHVLSAVVDRAGVLWVGTGAGLLRLRGERFEPAPAPLDALPVYRLSLGRSGAVYASTVGRGVARLGAGGTTWYGPERGLGPVVNVAVEDRDGALWLGTPTGLFREAAGRLERFGRPEGLGDERVWDVLEDAEGSIWVGTESGGPHRFRVAEVTTVGQPEGLPHDSVSALVADRAGDVWIATGAGVARVHGSRATAAPDARLSRVQAVSALRTRDGELWFGTVDGALARLRGARVTWYALPGRLPLAVRFLAEDAAGRVWVASEDGIARVDGDRLAPAEAELGLRPHLGGAFLAVDAAGALLVATPDAPLARLEGGRLAPVPGAPPAGVELSAVLPDPDGTLWIATVGQGLWRVRGGRGAAVTEAEGLPDDSPWSLLDDGRGSLWMSSNRGLARLSREDLDAVLARTRPALTPERLGRAAGMRTSEGNSGAPAGILDGAGRFWFATERGAAVVEPGGVRRGHAAPGMQVLEAVVDGRAVALDDGGRLTLPAGVRRLELRFRSRTLLPEDDRAHRFQLEGFDAAPVETAGLSAEYTHLPHGTYAFRVESRARDGAWGPPGTITVEVLPFPWERLPVQLAGLVLAAAVVGSLFVWRTWNLRARAAELQARVDDALAQVRTLRGLLPVCAWCRKVRTDDGYWHKLESYVQANTHAKFSHAMCPECYEKEMGEPAGEKPGQP